MNQAVVAAPRRGSETRDASAQTVTVEQTAKGRRERARRRAVSAAQKLGALAIAFSLWHWFANNRGEAAGIPTPARLVEIAAGMVTGSEYWAAVGNTLLTATIGFTLSVLVGVPLGLINGSSRRLEQSTQFVVDFGRTIPGVAILPLVLLLFGGTRTMALVLVMFSAVWPMLVQSTYAAQQLSPQMRQVARAFRISRSSRVRDIYLPSALPFIMTGLRIAATISLLITISAEFLGGASGLGQRLYQTLTVDDSDRMFVYVVTAGLLGVCVNWLLMQAQSRALWWHPSERAKR